MSANWGRERKRTQKVDSKSHVSLSSKTFTAFFMTCTFFQLWSWLFFFFSLLTVSLCFVCVCVARFMISSFFKKTSTKETTGLKRIFLVSCWAGLHWPNAMLVIQKQDLAKTWKKNCSGRVIFVGSVMKGKKTASVCFFLYIFCRPSLFLYYVFLRFLPKKKEISLSSHVSLLWSGFSNLQVAKKKEQKWIKWKTEQLKATCLRTVY